MWNWIWWSYRLHNQVRVFLSEIFAIEQAERMIETWDQPPSNLIVCGNSQVVIKGHQLAYIIHILDWKWESSKDIFVPTKDDNDSPSLVPTY